MNKNTIENESKTQVFNEDSENVSFDSIEQFRTRLALSRRQICLLLKVDPSAWSRWAKSENGAPPHIYQALQWYVQLVEANPEIHASYGLEKKLQAKSRESDMQIYQLKKQLQELKKHTDAQTSNAPMEEWAEKLQESFENVILKMTSQIQPQRVFEMETLKYENKKFQEKILDLQMQMKKVLDKLDTHKLKTSTKIVKKPKTKKKKAKSVKASSQARKLKLRKVLGKRQKRKLNKEFTNVGKRSKTKLGRKRRSKGRS